MSTSATVEPVAPDWPLLPTETEIYILPDGRIIIADLPAELARYLPGLGEVQPDTLPVAAVMPPPAGNLAIP
jgi:hypothetical protein